MITSAERDADRWWDGARRRAKDRLTGDASMSYPEFLAALDRISSPQWRPNRGERKMPSLWVIASYWAERDDWFRVDLEVPRCFACGLHGGHPEDEPDLEARWAQARRLERGHIVNWARNGLDGVQNLVPLCAYCNMYMPVFGIEEDEEATAWIIGGGAPGEIDIRLEAKGMTHAERELAWLWIMDQNGGPAFTAAERAAFERRLARPAPGSA